MGKKIFFLIMFFFLAIISYSNDSVVIESSQPTVKPGENFQLKVFLDVPEGLIQTTDNEFFFIKLQDSSKVVIKKIDYPEPVMIGDKLGYQGKIPITLQINVLNHVSSGILQSQLMVGYQLCNEDGLCFAPEETLNSFSINVTAAGGFITFNWLLILLFAFLGGLILNVMPCVLPVLSIKAMSLIHYKDKNKRMILLNSLAYSAGIAAFFLVLSILIIILKSGGELIGWGFQFQNAYYIIGLLTLLFVFSLALFDFFILPIPGIVVSSQLKEKNELLYSFFTGILTVLLATPCSAPLLGSALGFAFSQSGLTIMLIFQLIGLGLSFPFILIGFFPNIISKIPKPGKWMDTFKNLMGFLLLGTAIWLYSVLLKQVNTTSSIFVLTWLLLLTFALWLYQKLKILKPVKLLLILVLILSGGFSLLKNLSPQTRQETIQYGEVFSPELLKQYQADQIPVFIDFYADWCLTCKTNEKLVLFTDEIQSAFTNKNVKLLRGDFTNNDPIIANWIQNHGRAGVPVYLFYLPGEKEPILLPEIITKEMVLKQVAKIDTEKKEIIINDLFD
ncbi:MAG: thioredoxin family protein [Spirochaetes bacterium]|nr:thioredoxin family protein [Spirochaetota bacterium]